MTYQFLISDESVNSYGTRVLTAGIRYDEYLKNPIVLWNHIRAWSDKDNQVLPIGKVLRLWMENSKLYAEVEFDQNDEFAQKIEAKVAQKIINACSIGIAVVTTSEDNSVIVQGQSRPTIIECRLRELSIVDIPANKNCVRLYDDGTGKELTFAAGQDNFLLPLLKNQNEMNFKDDVLALLGLKEADDQAVINQITALMNGSKEATTLRERVTTLEGELQTYRDKEKAVRQAEIVSLVDGAIKERKITAAQREDYISLAEQDFDRTKKVLDSIAAVPEPESATHSDKADAWEERFREIRQRTAAGN